MARKSPRPAAAAAAAEVRALYGARLPNPVELRPLELESLADGVQRRLRAQGMTPIERSRLLTVIKEAWDWLWKKVGVGV